MTSPLRTSRSGLEFIKRFEGFRARAFRLPSGRWTIGHGHVKSARGGVQISRDDAEALLIYDLRRIEDELEACLLSPLNANQYDAIVSFVYNISPGQFRQSEVLRLINRGDHVKAAYAMEAWRKARINGKQMVVDALVRRRAAEKAMFLEHPTGPALCPTPLIAPELDVQWRGVDQNGESVSEQGDEQGDPADVQMLTEAVEALAEKTNASPLRQSSETLTVAIEKNAANDDAVDVHRPDLPPIEPANEVEHDDLRDQSVVEDLKQRINRVLAREEAAAEAKKSLQPTSEAALDDSNIAEIAEIVEGAAERGRGDATEFSAVAIGEFPERKDAAQPPETSDAFDLSNTIGDDDEDEKALPKRPLLDSPSVVSETAQRPTITVNSHVETITLSEPESVDRPDGKALWGAALIGAIGLMVWGGIKFFLTSRTTNVVSQRDIVFGPMLVLLGAVLCMIALYYVFARKDDPELV